MTTLEDVRRIGSSLPGAIVSHDGFSVSVPVKGKEKGFVWVWNERIEPKKARVPNPGVLALRVKDLDVKEMLLASDGRKFFTEPHYNGYPAVLIRLKEIEPDELEDLMIEAWKTKATPDLRKQLRL